MKLSVLRRTAAILVVAAVALSMSACYQPPGGVIDNTDTTTTTHEPKPTVPAKEGQLTLSLLLGLMKPDMKWSQLKPFTHSNTDDTHATFTVADNYGKECTLTVTYDEAADTVSQADLSYGDASVSVLTDNTLVIRTIMLAMNKE